MSRSYTKNFDHCKALTVICALAATGLNYILHTIRYNEEKNKNNIHITKQNLIIKIL